MTSQGLYLNWEGKKTYRQRIPTPRLLEDVNELSVGTTSQNMIIEGDNLQVLASLKSRYAGQVDVIYIDPPYNLGKEDFRYSDKRFHDPNADNTDAVYVTNEDGGRHTKWLNFMAPRLRMLWEMLHPEQGVIFISINEVELFRLGMLMDEIFDEKNRVGTLIWHAISDNNPTNIVTEHEYILCYARDKDKLPSRWVSGDSAAKTFLLEAFEKIEAESQSFEEMERKIAVFIKENKEFLGDLTRYRKVDANGLYGGRRNVSNPGKPGYKYDVLHPITGKPCDMPSWGWRFSPERMGQLIAQGRVLFGPDEHKQPQIKVYLAEVEFPLRSVVEIYAGAGSNDLYNLFAARDVFKNPKPVELIEMLLDYSTSKDSLVVDVFAGSGTTGEAVLRLNKRDGGKRRFILIEEGNGKDKFCRTLTAERIKRAIEKYSYDDGFQFFTTGRKLDREAIVSLERKDLANLICQTDETGRGKGIVRLHGYNYIIGKNHRSEAICLVWNGADNSEVTPNHLRQVAQEVTQAGLARPFRIYGTFCRVADSKSFQFCQIPDKILAQMYIRDDIGDEE